MRLLERRIIEKGVPKFRLRKHAPNLDPSVRKYVHYTEHFIDEIPI